MFASTRAKTFAVTALDVSGVAWLLKGWLGGRGTILCLHRVIEPDTDILSRGVAVTSSQLESILQCVRQKEWDIVPLSEVPQRLRQRCQEKRFIVITLDDGYADNLYVAAPLFQRYNAPFSVFVNSGIVDRSVIPWYPLLEQIVLRNAYVEIPHPTNGLLHFVSRTGEEKRSALSELRSLGWKNTHAMTEAVRTYCLNYDDSLESLTNQLFLSWSELRLLDKHPLGTIGSHTVSHERLTTLSEEDAYREMKADQAKLQHELGHPIEDIAYPFGTPTECGVREFELARQVGYVRGVTTEPWNLFPQHLGNLLALPRVTLSMAHSPNARFLRISAYGAWNAVCALLR